MTEKKFTKPGKNLKEDFMKKGGKEEKVKSDKTHIKIPLWPEYIPLPLCLDNWGVNKFIFEKNAILTIIS